MEVKLKNNIKSNEYFIKKWNYRKSTFTNKLF